MGLLRNREGKEGDIKPRNQILQTPESVTPESKEKLDNKTKENNNPFKESLKVSPDQLNKEKLDRKDGKASGNSEGDNPDKGQREIGDELER